MGKQTVPSPDYSNAGANRDKPRAADPTTTIGESLLRAASQSSARAVIDAAPASHQQGIDTITIDLSLLDAGPLKDAAPRTIADALNWISAQLSR